MCDRVFLCRPDKDLKEWKEHPWIDVKFNGENIENCTFFEVCKWKMWTEMENANIEKLCRYFSDKKVHQELTCFSVNHLYPTSDNDLYLYNHWFAYFFLCFRVYHIPLLTTFTFSYQWTSWYHQLSYITKRYFATSPSLWGWFHMITLFMFSFFSIVMNGHSHLPIQR